MPDLKLLEAARSNARARGLLTADRYLSPALLADQTHPSGKSVAADELIRQAAEKLTFLGETKMLDETAKGYDGSDDLLLKRHAIVSTGSKDRDRDEMNPAGATFKTKVLLWQHDPMLPIGPVWGGFGHDKAVECDFGICDVFGGLGKDAATLVRAGALQMSHGFDPTEIEPAKSRDDRFKINAYEIFEVSLVSVPSNSDAGPTGEAVMDFYVDGKFTSAWVKGWAKQLVEARPTSVKVPADIASAKDKGADDTCGDDPAKNRESGGETLKNVPVVETPTDNQTDVDRKCGGTHTCPKCGHKFGGSDMDDDQPQGGSSGKSHTTVAESAKAVTESAETAIATKSLEIEEDAVFASLGL